MRVRKRGAAGSCSSLTPELAAEYARAVLSPRRCAVAAVFLLSSLCLATDVRVVGVTPGRSADVQVGNADPLTLQIGEETLEGVKLLRADRDRAVLRVDGVTKTLPVVAARQSEGNAGGGGTVVLSADRRGQFSTPGYVNGQAVRFVVDTGASTTTLSAANADRIGLDYDRGTPMKAMTANGVVDGWRVSLDSVRIAGLTVRDVDAVVVNNDTLPVVLLGMNFLGQFDMLRQGTTLVLRRRR